MADIALGAMPFTNLHVHTEYSVFDGLAHPVDLVRRAKELGQTALAITDHGTLTGVIPFVQACRDEGVKPIVGCELYVTAESRRDRPKRDDENFAVINETYHIVALAQNRQGYRNLLKLSSLSYLEGFRYKPRVDHELLQQYGEGLFILSGCLGGELAQAIITGDEEKAREIIEFYKSTFPGRYALELQNHFIEDEAVVRQALVQFSKEYDLPLVATADNHFVSEEQAQLHELWLCVQSGDELADPERFKFDGQGYHLASAQEMLELFPDTPEAVSNAALIAESCELDMSGSNVQLPIFPNMEKGLTAKEMLAKLTKEGIAKRYPGGMTPEIEDRMNMELKVINDAGFPDYFLIVWDLVHHAEEVGISVAPGRGSAAGSIVSYALGITGVDPIKHELLFERFLNAERVSMPDIDIDFEDRGREAIIEYARSVYGAEKVAQIIVIKTLGPKEACSRVAKAYGIPLDDKNMLNRLISEDAETLEEALATSTQLAAFVRDNPWTHPVIDGAKELVGYVSGASIHPAGVVVTRDPLLDEIPLQFPPGKAHASTVISQFDKDILGDLKFLKIDVLGNKNLAIIKDALKIVEQDYGLHIEVEQIPPDDSATMFALGQGDTVGVFQMEAAGATGILREMQPKSLADIGAANALNRPGPLRGIVEEAHTELVTDPRTGAKSSKQVGAKTVVAAYMERRRHPERMQVPIPEVESILAETQGLILYQDQVMQIANQVARYSLGEADILRAAMGKKNPEKMAHEKEKFLDGATRNGVTAENAEQLWDYIDKFAGYGFGKAHSYAYGQLGYYTAWVKCHYPLEFTTALCNSRGGTFEAIDVEAKSKPSTIQAAIRDAKAHQIKVANPDVNLSQADFSISDRAEQTIAYGLAHIKRVGELPAQSIVSEREANGPYRSLFELVERNQAKGLSMAAVRLLWKQEKGTANLASLDAMVAAGAVGEASLEVAKAALAEREQHGPYKSFAQVLERNGLKTGTNQATWESLVRSGACDEFGPRRHLLELLPQVLEQVNKLKSTSTSQLDRLANQEEELRKMQLSEPRALLAQDLDDEEFLLGLSLSGHRMDIYQQELAKQGVMTKDEVVSAARLPQRIRVAGNIKSTKYTKTKKGAKPMAIVNLEDATGEFSVMVWEDGLDNLRRVIDSGNAPLVVEGYRMPHRAGIDESDNLTLAAQRVQRLVADPVVVVTKGVQAKSAPVELLAPETEELVAF